MKLRSILRSLTRLGGSTCPARRPARNRASWRPHIEQLEGRWVPSSIQVVALGKGAFELRVSGDNDANEVTLDGQGASGQGPGDAVAVTIDDASQTVDHITRVVVSTAGGDDSITMGGQWMNLQRVRVNTGSGNDTFTLAGADFNGSQALSFALDLGTGDNNASYEDITFAGGFDLYIYGSSGSDQVSILCNEFPGATQFNFALGGGDNKTQLQQNKFADRLLLTVGGAAGADLLDVGYNDFAGKAEIMFNAGNGDNSATLMENTFHAAVATTLNFGNGIDVAGMFCNEISGAADVKFNLGAADNSATLMENTFGGGLEMTLNAAGGNDVVGIFCNEISGAANLGFNLGNGDNSATFSMDTFTGSVRMRLNTGTGQDTVGYEDFVVTGPLDLRVNLGLGDDDANFGLTQLGNSGRQNIVIDGGGGGDRIAVDFSVAGTDPALQPTTVRVLGSSGDDELSLNVEGDAQFLGAALLLIDGGFGIDTAHAGPFVQAKNCEK